MSEDTRPDYEIAREALTALMVRERLVIASTFIPWSKSRWAPGKDPKKPNGWRTLNWTITLMYTPGPGPYVDPVKQRRNILTTEYSAGDMHCPAQSCKNRKGREIDEMKALEVETGKVAKWPSYAAHPLPTVQDINPDPVDVFAALVRDAHDALEYGSFEEWANNLGLDVDSRKAEKSYDTVLKQGLALRHALGDKDMQEAAKSAAQL